MKSMEDCVDELLNTLSDFNNKAGKTEDTAEEEEEEEDKGKGTSKSDDGGGLIEQFISHLPVPIPGISSASVAAGKSAEEDEDRDNHEGKLEADGEKGSSKSNNGGGLMEQLISHLHVPIAGISSTSAAGESADEDRDGDKPAGKRTDEKPEGIVISSPRITLPVENGPDTEEATILISIIHD